MNELLQINKANTALVVIDLQKGIVSLPAKPYNSDLVVSNAAKLIKAFQKNQMPVFLTKVTSSSDAKDGLKPITDGKPLTASGMKPEWSEIVAELNPEPADFIITKRQWGAFYGTELDLQLRRRQIETIVLCGIATNIGIESTARNAYELGYQQIFVEDAMSAHSQAEHDQTIKIIFPRIGRVRKTEDILTALK